jgi:hypothetical protein
MTSNPVLYGFTLCKPLCTTTRAPVAGAYWPAYQSVCRSNVRRRPNVLPKLVVDQGTAFGTGGTYTETELLTEWNQVTGIVSMESSAECDTLRAEIRLDGWIGHNL